MALRSLADGALFAEVMGDGPPRVLALHGWGRRGSDFAGSLRGLPAIAPDLPGFGASPPPDDVIGAAGYAEIIADLLPEFDRPPVLVGHSFGGRVAVALAASRPEHVGALVLTGVPLLRLGRSTRPAVGYRVVRWMQKRGVVSEERLERERQKRGSADYRAARGVMRDILVKVVNESYEAELATLRSPVRLLWGELDAEAPVSTARAALEMLQANGADASLEVLGGIGHMLPLEDPAALRSVVDSVS